MKATAKLKMLPVSVLKPAAYNPRKKLKPGDKEYEKIKNSITEFGFADPLVVNADMTRPPEIDRSDGAGLHRSALRGGGHRQDQGESPEHCAQ